MNEWNPDGNLCSSSFKPPLLILKICENFLIHDLVVKNYAMFNDDSVAISAFLKIFFSRICAHKVTCCWPILHYNLLFLHLLHTTCTVQCTPACKEQHQLMSTFRSRWSICLPPSLARSTPSPRTAHLQHKIHIITDLVSSVKFSCWSTSFLFPDFSHKFCHPRRPTSSPTRSH